MIALVATALLLAPSLSQEKDERTAAAARELPAVLRRTPSELPRATAERWKGFFDAASEEELLARAAALPPAVREGLAAGETAYRAADYPAALEALYALLEDQPDLPPALLILGTTYFRLRRYGDSVVAYDESGRLIARVAAL